MIPTSAKTPPPNLAHYPEQGAAWLLARHTTPRGLVDRLGLWYGQESDYNILLPNLEGIAEAVNAYDADAAAWSEYAERHPSPDSDELYDAWEKAGPESPPAARIIGPMSSGEHRMVRMLAVLASGPRIRFNLLTDSYGVDQPFRQDWALLILGRESYDAIVNGALLRATTHGNTEWQNEIKGTL